MIARLPGWSWEPQGGGITLVPASGGATLRYRERVRPVQSVAAILRDHAADRRFRPTTTSPIEALVTNEGEYAAVVDQTCETDTGLVQRTLGFVFTDDWYCELAGLATRTELFDPLATLVRHVLRDVRLSLGVRRRRFVYTPPAGWYGHARLPQYTTWFPPEHPLDASSINIYPALPAQLGATETESLAMLPIGPPASADVLSTLTPRQPLRLARLGGSVWELEILDEARRQMVRRVAILRDARYLYTAYLDAPYAMLEYQRSVFDELLASIEPLPSPGVHGSPELAEDYL